MVGNSEVLHSPRYTALLFGASINPASSEAAWEALASQLLLAHLLKQLYPNLKPENK